MHEAAAVLATRLNALFETARPEGERPPSLESVAQWIDANTTTSISIGYLSEMRRGQVANPRVDHLRALAAYFGVSVSYFVDDTDSEETIARMRLLQALDDAQIRSIALRATAVSAADLHVVAQLVESLAERSDHTA